MSKLKYKAILFDNDGTIVDTKQCILTSVAYTLKKWLGDEDFDRQKFVDLIGLPVWDQFAKYSDDVKTIDKMVVTYRKHNNQLLLTDSYNFPGIPEVLLELKNKGYFLGIVTSKMHGICVKGLEVLGILDLFEYIQGSDDSYVHKPNGGCLLHTAKTLKLDIKDIIYVGDSIYDIQAGNNSGCDTCAVTWGCGSLESLSKENPTYIVNSPDDLLTIF